LHEALGFSITKRVHTGVATNHHEEPAMKTYQVTLTISPNRTILRNILASDLDSLYTIIQNRYPCYRVLGPSAIRCLDSAR